MSKYKQIISLGYFCPVALELERLGLRSKSSPFDWCISNFSGIIDCIDKKFDRFLDYDLLEQCADNSKLYKNPEYGISFYHDFGRYQPLSKQLPAVKEKYERRISAFYKNLNNSVLFVRYISDDPDELSYIENNCERINSVLKNDIVYVATEDVKSDKIKIYNVPCTYDGMFYHINLEDNEELMQILNSVDIPEKESNLTFYRKKEAKKNSKLKKLTDRLKVAVLRRIHKEYSHDKKYRLDDKFLRKQL